MILAVLYKSRESFGGCDGSSGLDECQLTVSLPSPSYFNPPPWTKCSGTTWPHFQCGAPAVDDDKSRSFSRTDDWLWKYAQNPLYTLLCRSLSASSAWGCKSHQARLLAGENSRQGDLVDHQVIRCHKSAEFVAGWTPKTVTVTEWCLGLLTNQVLETLKREKDVPVNSF